MSDERKKITIEVKADAYAVLEEYCQQTNQDSEKIAGFLFAKSLEDFADGYENLKNGYREMGQLNLEISDAFTVSENEAFNHVDYSD
jgi:hypothetical protein